MPLTTWKAFVICISEQKIRSNFLFSSSEELLCYLAGLGDFRERYPSWCTCWRFWVQNKEEFHCPKCNQLCESTQAGDQNNHKTMAEMQRANLFHDLSKWRIPKHLCFPLCVLWPLSFHLSPVFSWSDWINAINIHSMWQKKFALV